MVDGNRVAVPTLIMMKGVAENIKAPFMNFKYASQSVTALHEAGVTVLAGTDANTQPGSPSKVPHGESLHQELELLVEAGISTVEVLRAATVLPAQCFGLDDRGVVAVGKRADLLLIAEDPIKDISATRSIQKVWCCGSEVFM
jgi:imidazolonepropionase-like amidohydrolase